MGANRRFRDPRCTLQTTGFQRTPVQMKGIEKDCLNPQLRVGRRVHTPRRMAASTTHFVAVEMLVVSKAPVQGKQAVSQQVTSPWTAGYEPLGT